jgi:hypothetical protein
LTRLRGREVLVDAADLPLFERERLSINVMHRRGDRVYAYAWLLRPGGRGVPLHRHLTGAPAGLVVDHINGNTLDNRRSNLRVCTRAENGRNRARNQRHSTGYKCVAPHRSGYIARIQHNGRRIFLGCFKSPEEAHRAYERAANELHGEFARVA